MHQIMIRNLQVMGSMPRQPLTSPNRHNAHITHTIYLLMSQFNGHKFTIKCFRITKAILPCQSNNTLTNTL